MQGKLTGKESIGSLLAFSWIRIYWWETQALIDSAYSAQGSKIIDSDVPLVVNAFVQ